MFKKPSLTKAGPGAVLALARLAERSTANANQADDFLDKYRENQAADRAPRGLSLVVRYFGDRELYIDLEGGGELSVLADRIMADLSVYADLQRKLAANALGDIHLGEVPLELSKREPKGYR